MKKNFYSYVIVLASMLAMLTSCDERRVGPTEVLVVDPVRHYYPINLGEKLELYYELQNNGDQPFIITDIQPSCGCISELDEKKRVVIFPGKSRIFHFTFNANRNAGYVHHTIRVFGNVKPSGMLPLEFDTNIVMPSVNTPDYEEYYSHRKHESDLVGKTIQEAVDGIPQEREGYETDEVSTRRWFDQYTLKKVDMP